METKKSARDKLLEFIARRDHSPLELKMKLQRYFENEDVERAIEEARQLDWLPTDEDLSRRVAETLHRKNKSNFYICGYLRKKGLPQVHRDDEVELAKAQKLLFRHFRKDIADSPEERAEFRRFLSNRGYDDQTIRRTLNERR